MSARAKSAEAGVDITIEAMPRLRTHKPRFAEAQLRLRFVGDVEARAQLQIAKRFEQVRERLINELREVSEGDLGPAVEDLESITVLLPRGVRDRGELAVDSRPSDEPVLIHDCSPSSR